MPAAPHQTDGAVSPVPPQRDQCLCDVPRLRWLVPSATRAVDVVDDLAEGTHMFSVVTPTTITAPQLPMSAASAETSSDRGILVDSPTVLTICPAGKRDFWRHTFYSPTLVKDDGNALLAYVPIEAGDVTIDVTLRLNAMHQFDQAGLLVRIDSERWVKAGFEYVDGQMRLSCVVTNGHSDWSTQRWSQSTTVVSDDEVEAQGRGPRRVVCCAAAKLRITRVRGDSVVFEAAPLGDAAYEMIRIAHLRVTPPPSPAMRTTDAAVTPSVVAAAAREPVPWLVGPFAASPTTGGGCRACFTDFNVAPAKPTAHSTEIDHNSPKKSQ